MSDCGRREPKLSSKLSELELAKSSLDPAMAGQPPRPPQQPELLSTVESVSLPGSLKLLLKLLKPGACGSLQLPLLLLAVAANLLLLLISLKFDNPKLGTCKTSAMAHKFVESRFFSVQDQYVLRCNVSN